MGVCRGVCLPAIAHDDEGAGGEGCTHAVGAGQGRRRVGGGDPDRFHAPVQHRVEEIDGFEAGPRREVRCLPEAAQRVHLLGVIPAHVGGKLVGEAADLAPAHRVGLAGNAERPRAGPADAARGKVAVDDGVALVRPGGGLVDALGKGGEHALRAREEVVESFHRLRVHAALLGDGFGRRCVAPGDGERVEEAGGVPLGPGAVEDASLVEIGEQALEQDHVRAGRDGQVQVGHLGSGSAPRVEHDDLRAPRGTGRLEALVEHGMAPGRVAPHEHGEVGCLPILVGARHHVFSEGADVPGDGGRHAQAGVRVYVAAADEALHQLIGDVVVLGEELAGDVEGHAVRPVPGDGLLEAAGDEVERLIPRRVLAAEPRPEEAPGVAQRLPERRALGAEAAVVGGVCRVARDRNPPWAVRAREHAAADAAVGAGGADRGRHGLFARRIVHTIEAWSSGGTSASGSATRAGGRGWQGRANAALRKAVLGE